MKSIAIFVQVMYDSLEAGTGVVEENGLEPVLFIQTGGFVFCPP